jgi:hypothetical protein
MAAGGYSLLAGGGALVAAFVLPAARRAARPTNAGYFRD